MSDTKIIEAAIEAALTSMEVTKNHLELTPRDRIVMMLAAALPHLHQQSAFQLAGSEPLWCLHVLGMDDVHPAPTKAHAEKAAAWHNEQFKEQAARIGITVEAVVAPWPHSAESHAAGVADFIPEWLIPQWQLDALESKAAPPAQGIALGQVREIRIPARNKLDPISVFVQDQAAGRGRIIVTCYGNAWQAFWGAMGERTVMEFVAQCDADYVAGNMLQGRQTRIAKHEREYAARVAAEVISEFRALAGQGDAAPGVANA